jgi:hypothetical protein
MSRLQKASIPPVRKAFSAASTLVNTEEILDCLTAYYNENTVDISSPFFDAFGYARFNGIERLAAKLLLESERWFGAFGVRIPSIQDEKPAVPMIAAELHKHRAEFRAAVKWLCTEKPETDGVARIEKSLVVLGKVGRYPDIDQTSEKFVRYFEEHGLKHVKLHVMLLGQRLFLHTSCTHWVDLFCTFLLRECSGRLPHQMPIKLCRHCGKLFSSTRSDTEFCPKGGCQRKNFWSEERHNDYEFVRRYMKIAEYCASSRSGYALQDLRTKLEKPRVKQRLQLIQERWRDWPRILKMIKTIGETAQLSKGSQ